MRDRIRSFEHSGFLRHSSFELRHFLQRFLDFARIDKMMMREIERCNDREPGQSARAGKVALPFAARAEPGGMVSLGEGGVRESAAGRQTDFSLNRLFHLSLVPCHGA